MSIDASDDAKANTKDVSSLFAQAVAEYSQGKISESKTLCRQVLDRVPEHFDALHLLSVILLQSGQYEAAITELLKAAEINPTHADVRCHLGSALLSMGNIDGALSRFDEALERNPSSAMALHNKGLAFRKGGLFKQSIESFDKALQVKPQYAEALNHKGLSHYDLGEYETALACFDKALEIEPRFLFALNNRGLALLAIGHSQAALECFNTIEHIDPSNTDAQVNKAKLLRETGQINEAIHCLEKALTKAPDHPILNWNLSTFYLLSGELEKGFRLFEWRHKRPDAPAPRVTGIRPWLGETDLAGKTLYVYWEQGYGDTLQMYRFVRILAEQGVKITLQVRDALIELIRDTDPRVRVIGPDEDPGAYAAHCPMLSLPLALGISASTLPAPEAYLDVAPGFINKWEGLLDGLDGRKIGIAWRGSPTQVNDHNRSIDFHKLQPLLDMPLTYVSLQKDIPVGEIQLLETRDNVFDYSDEIGDFRDTAALCASMDLIITVDTSVAHLAAALGKPVWLLLSTKHDWRWLLDREDSPWYPTVRLFRQSSDGNWEEVLDRVQVALAALASQKL